MAGSLNAIIVDDYRMSRSYFEMMTNSDPRIEQAVSFSDAASAVEYCSENEVDLVIMDVLMRSGPDGLTAARLIKEENPEIKIILATSTAEAEWIEKAREIGVESFWFKEYSSESFSEVLDRTLKGESVYPLEEPNVQFGNVRKLDLTERDLDVLRELMFGLTNEEIAKRLDISVNTVRTHIQNMLIKTGYRNRLELVIHSASLGVVVGAQHCSVKES